MINLRIDVIQIQIQILFYLITEVKAEPPEVFRLLQQTQLDCILQLKYRFWSLLCRSAAIGCRKQIENKFRRFISDILI